MTSSVAASTGIFIPNASETPEKGTKSRGIEDETAGVPITDKQTATQPDTPVSIEKWKKPPNLNSNSKIPHPLAALLATKANPFRRSHSVRMRGSKSSSLFKTFSQENYCHSCCNQSNNKVHTPYPHTVSQQRRRACNAMEFACGANTRTAANNNTTLPSPNDEATSADQVTHELLAAGSVSPRRRLVLNSQTNVAPASPRSLSLSRSQNLSQNSNSKTAASTEACNAEESQKVATVPQHNGCVEDRKEEISSSSLSADLSSGNASSSTCKGRPDGHGSPLCQGDPGMRAEQQNKMSLNPNGPQTTGTNARPTTLAPATATGAAATATKTVTKSAAPKTPKTPTSRGSQGQQQVSSPHNCGNQNCSSSKLQHQVQSQTLPTVPEAFKPTPRTPPVTPDSPSNYIQDDIDSLYSFATTTSGRSTMSCEHPYVACNGTTFSGRKMKYVVHCSNYAGQVGPDYLTPTQRAQRQIRRLKELLSVARQDLEEKDSEILRLTREVVELRLFKASLSSPEERSASSDAVTVREAELKTSQDVSPIVDMVDDATKTSPRHLAIHHHHQQQHALHLSTSEMQSSFADSGHFEDMTSSSVHSKDSYATGRSHEMACSRNTPAAGGADGLDDDEDEGADEARNADSYEYQRQKLIRMYEQRIEELIRTQDSASSEIKRSHNDKVEALLQKLAECNTRYADIVPDYEHAKERIRELEKQLEDLQRKLAEHDEKQNKMYLHMYQKGQEAERIARADQALELAHRSPNNKVSINQLLHQLQSTQDELENIRAAECRKETGGNHALLTAKEAISLWVLGARKTIYRRLLDAQKNRSHVDPEVTLQFLKSAIYYFLTDKENSQGHLQAIESILEFTEAEKQNISKARSPK